MMRNMRLTRLTIVLPAVALAVVGVAGQAAGGVTARHAVRVSSRAARPGAAGLRAIDAAAMSDALVAARSTGLVRQRAIAAAAATAEPFLPTPGSLAGLFSACSIEDESGEVSGPSETGATDDASASSATGTTELGELIPAGHLTGTSSTQVLDYRLGLKKGVFSAGVTARSARTGAAIWSRTIAGVKGDFPFPFPELDHVGTPSKPGVLLINQSDPLFANGTNPVTLTVKAVSGAGVTLWTRTLTGSITLNKSGETLTNVPTIAGDIHDRAGAGHDLLVNVINATLSFKSLTITESGSVQPEVLSAADGTVSSRGALATSTSGEPEAAPSPDLNRDGLDDITVSVPGSHGSGHVVAEQGNTGAVIWTSRNVPVRLGADVEPIGFVSHAHTQDLIVSNEPKTFSRSGSDDSEFTSISLVDGTTGRLLWTHRAVCAFDIGHAGRHLQRAVGLVTDAGNTESSKSSTSRVTMVVRAVHGRVIVRRTVTATVTAKRAAHSGSAIVEVKPFGDIQPDRAADLLVKVSATLGSTTVSKTVMLSGRNGADVDLVNGMPTDGSLQRGAGTDLVKVTKGSTLARRAMIAGYDAATGKQFYRRSIARTHGLHGLITYGIRVTGHHCSDLVVNAVGATGSFTGLLDAKGDPLWTLRAGAGRITGGRVTDTKAPAAYCVA
jgi:hypothetical protein